MPRARRSAPLAAVASGLLAASVFVAGCQREPTTEEILAAVPAASEAAPGGVRISYPLDGTLFPPDIVAPTFVWEDETSGVDRWHVVVRDEAGAEVLHEAVDAPRWRPSEERWAEIKRRSDERDAEVVVAGAKAGRAAVLSSARLRIRTSKDPVADSLFYREVPLPFIKAVRDPSRIRWRYGTVDMEDGPPIVLSNLPVCGNCHSFADDGSVLGLDVDYGNDKGAYAVMDVSKRMVMDDEKIITWADYKREDGELTFGLLSRVSPDGRYVISTVKDRSVFVAMPDLMISQLFFPIKGILVVHDRETGEFFALPGADDPQYVQSNAVWSPDGEEIVFARAKAYRTTRFDQKNNALVDLTDVPEFTRDNEPFRYDLYRIPFNGGKGGTPEPLEGASNDGMSNYFPKYSPDGKWIVFCKADNYMLLRPDSELYIVPAAGGEARRLRYNTARMNSWHSWSSNSRWLVFSSKLNGPYTQLFLTHIDDAGNDTPPVLLERFTSRDRAANIPEFVKLPGDAIASIREQFLDAYSFLRAGLANENTGDHKGAERAFRRGLEIAPDDAELHNALGWTLFQDARPAEAVAEYERALAADPDHVKSHNNLALALVQAGKLEEAESHYRQALPGRPTAETHNGLGYVLGRQGRTDEAIAEFRKAIEADPKFTPAHNNLAQALESQGRLDEAASHYRRSLELEPSPAVQNALDAVLRRRQASSGAADRFTKLEPVLP